MVALVIIVLDECLNIGLKCAWQIVIFQQDAVLHGLVPALALVLRLRMGWRASDMLDTCDWARDLWLRAKHQRLRDQMALTPDTLIYSGSGLPNDFAPLAILNFQEACKLRGITANRLNTQ